MTINAYNPLSDMSRIKDSLITLFCSSEDITRLVGQCYDTPYIEGTVSENSCAIFVETYLIRLKNQHIKEVGVDITVVCHKDCIKLSQEDKAYYEAMGIYGNRVDSAIQAINSSIQSCEVMEKIRENYSIGGMSLIEENPLQQYVPGTEFYGKVLHYTYQNFYKRKNSSRQVMV